MGLQLEDGLGRGFLAQIDSEGHLVVDALNITEMSHTSDAHGLAFTWSSGTYDAAAGDTILLIKNTSSTRHLAIEVITLSSDTDTRVVIHLPTTEVIPTGTTVVGVNLNTASNNTADATGIRDETNNAQGNIIWSGEIHAASDPYKVPTMGAILIGQNDSIAIDYVADVAACDVVIYGYFD